MTNSMGMAVANCLKELSPYTSGLELAETSTLLQSA